MQEKYRKPQISTVGLVARYKLWAGLTDGSTVFDYSLGGNIGIVTGAVPAYPGILFDASDDEINCGSDSTIDDLFAGGGTFACWLLSNGRGENNVGRVVDKTEWRLRSINDAATLQFRQAFTGEDGEWEFSLTAGVWQHIVIAYDNVLGANDPTVYINGVSVNVSEEQAPGSDTATSDVASNLIIGDAASSAESWDGKIGETMLFDRELTAAEVKSIYELTKWRYT